MDLCYNGVCNDNITLGVIPCATTTILYYPNEKSYYFFLAKGCTFTYIANKLGRNKSTISRKLHRNAPGKHYLPVDAPLTDRYGKGFIKKLRHHGKKRHLKGVEERRGKFPVSHDISERTAGAVHRSRRGHFEADTVAGKKGKACLVTLVDRKSRYLLSGE